VIANPRAFRNASSALLSVLALAGCDTVATVRFMFANDRTEALWESEAETSSFHSSSISMCSFLFT